jgi:hypothetical protein
LGVWRYDETIDSLETDCLEKMTDLVLQYDNAKGEPSFPYRPLSSYALEEAKKVKGSPATYDGLVDFTTFQKLFEKDPYTFFVEMKLRTIMMNAYKMQVEELHTTAKTMDANISVLNQWALNMGQQLKDRESATPAPASDDVSAALDRLSEELAEKNGDILDLQATVSDYARMVRTMNLQIDEMKKTKPVRRLDVDGAGDHDSVTHHSRHHTPATDYTAGGSKVQRSVKVDVPEFYNDKNKDTVTFGIWHRMMSKKMQVNDDHFANDLAKQTYIEGRIRGKAAENLYLYLDDDSPNAINSSKALLAHLWTQYHDPNELEKALDKFNSLTMKPGDDYTDFVHTFVRLAGQSRKPSTEWKSEFKRKVLPSISDKLVRDYMDPTVDFHRYTALGAQIALTYSMKKDKAPPTGTGNGHNGGSGGGRRRDNPRDSQRPATTTSTSQGGLPTRNAAGVDKDKIRQYALEGKCFQCGEKGHMKADCPKKRARIDAIVSKYSEAESNKDKVNTSSDSEDDGKTKN